MEYLSDELVTIKNKMYDNTSEIIVELIKEGIESEGIYFETDLDLSDDDYFALSYNESYYPIYIKYKGLKVDIYFFVNYIEVVLIIGSNKISFEHETDTHLLPFFIKTLITAL